MPPQESVGTGVGTPPQEPVSPEPVEPFVPTRPLRAVVGALIAVVAVGAAFYGYKLLRASLTPPAPAKTYVIGILYYPQQNDAVIAFQQNMERLGYKEGVNVRYDLAKVSVGPTMIEEFTAAADRMITAQEDLIYATFENETAIALQESKKYGSDVPIVFLTRFHDPVEYGLINSYKSSGNNATGIATNVSETIGRTLGFLKEIRPNLKKLGVFSDGFMVGDIGGAYLIELRKQAPKFGMEVVEYKTSAPPGEAEAEFQRVAASIKPGDIDGLFHIAGHFIGPQEALENELATRLKIPMSAPNEDLPNGGMFSYSDLASAAGEQAAVLADKIFKGAKPSDIPVEFNAKYELTLVLGRARAAGITFPDSMLFIATNKYEDSSSFPEVLHER
ncbi:ABC transporter substrate-binding protein [Candidatus Kaiserbacteria bacterium]|nr:ABC transporter substrate-binding protein [Candidatus Kaiserbacteria bacterium]